MTLPCPVKGQQIDGNLARAVDILNKRGTLGQELRPDQDVQSVALDAVQRENPRQPIHPPAQRVITPSGLARYDLARNGMQYLQGCRVVLPNLGQLTLGSRQSVTLVKITNDTLAHDALAVIAHPLDRRGNGQEHEVPFDHTFVPDSAGL